LGRDTVCGPTDISIESGGWLTVNVRDNALLLDVIAGPDGLDSRQRDVRRGDYVAACEAGAKGLRIGVLREGFGHPNSEADVDAKVFSAARHFETLGATVEEVSVPMHMLGHPICARI